MEEHLFCVTGRFRLIAGLQEAECRDNYRGEKQGRRKSARRVVSIRQIQVCNWKGQTLS